MKSLAGYREEIYASQKMNYILWDFNQTGTTTPYKSYEDSVADLKEFVEKRHDWLSHTIEDWVGCQEADISIR